ncbi:MAG: hypothetical protein L0H41_15300 [Microlunatus sp.]|nr:hypothetical protein [Microlunatus sp.]
MTTTNTTSTTQAPAPAKEPSQLSIARSIWARAVADKATVVGVLAFYGLAIGAGVGALWPPLRDVFADLSLPAAFDSLLGGVPLNTPAGWVNAEMMSIMAPGFLIAAAMISAGAATAGEEQGRTLGLVLSTGASRTTFLAAKSAAVLTHVLIVALGMFLGLLAGNAIGGMGLSVTAMIEATLWMIPIALMYAAIALTVGALTGDKRLTISLTAGIAAVSFVLSVLLPMSQSLSGWAKINLWYPYSANVALIDGIDWGLAALTIAIAAAVSAVGFIGFQHRSNLRG